MEHQKSGNLSPKEVLMESSRNLIDSKEYFKSTKRIKYKEEKKMADEQDKIVHPGIKDSRVLLYLNQLNHKDYINTPEENYLLNLWRQKYYIAQAEYKKSRCAPEKIDVWRKAYEGKFKKLDDFGELTDQQMKAIRKLGFELVESKVNAHIPTPKMSPRYHADLVPVAATEKLISHEMDRILSEEVNDESEHNVLIDGTSWFKVSWNPFDNTHERSGNPEVTVCPVDTVFPQPGVKNYKHLEYIFEQSTITMAQCLDLYGRYISSPTENDIIPIVNCYFLNKDRFLGKFTWCEETGQVICNDLEWGIRKRRECTQCHTVVPFASTCPICGSNEMRYVSVKEEVLKDDLQYVTNPYRTGETDDKKQDQNQFDQAQAIPAGTKIPYYLIRQLPFVPYRRVNVPKSVYGISEIELQFEDQDLINKMLNKVSSKIGKSRTWVTKLKDTNINDNDDEVAFVEVESPQEGQSIQVKQVMADVTQEITGAQMLYDIAKSTVGVTNTDQGKEDPTARSGKAKQIQMAASAQRNDAPNTLRNLAFSGVYELIFKYMLAYSDEQRSFVSLLPDGTPKEEVWSKYMFLSQDDEGNFYYRDDYAWSVDTATEITQDRAAMWQLIDQDFINGTMGNNIDPTRALLMYWQMKDQYQYPTAKFAIDFIKDSVKHLPTQVEQALVNNPEAVEIALSYIQDLQTGNGVVGQANAKMNAGQQGGARSNAGREGNGQSHAANVEKTNNKNRAQSGSAQTTTQATSQGGMQGGTKTPYIPGGDQ